MRTFVLAGLAACGFQPRLIGRTLDAPSADAVADAAGDARSQGFCEQEPSALLCFSFDQAPEPATLLNEASAAASAAVTNVAAEPHGNGYAAVFGATSEMFVAQAPQVTGIEAVEVWFRLDAIPADGQRYGFYDSNVGPNNMSLFLNRTGTAYTLRCGLGNETTTWAATVATATWSYAACICTGTNQQMWLNGVNVGDTPGPCSNGGTIVADGLTIGSNNNGGPTNIDSQLIGAIDAIRFSTVAPSATQICERAGLTGC